MLQIPVLSNEAIAGWVVAAGVTLLNYKIKLDVKGAIDNAIKELRSEFGGAFLPVPIASEQRANMIERIASLERMHDVLRERYHKQSNDITEKMFEQNAEFVEKIIQRNSEFTTKIFDYFSKLEEGLREKARRLSAAEAKITTNEEAIQDHSVRLRNLEHR
jgi:hypothetical protein